MSELVPGDMNQVVGLLGMSLDYEKLVAFNSQFNFYILLVFFIY